MEIYEFVLANDDRTQSQRSAVFWSVVGVVCGLVVLLTLSDLLWDEIARSIGCPWDRFKCCSNRDDIDENEFRLNESSTNENNITAQQIIMSDPSSKEINYHAMNTIWNPDQLRNETASNSQYNGYQSSDPNTTPNNVLIHTTVLAKHNAKETEDRCVYTVDIASSNETTSKTKNPADTMVS